MKYFLSLLTVVLMSACAHHGDHTSATGGGDCAHCKKMEKSGEHENCKGGCSH